MCSPGMNTFSPTRVRSIMIGKDQFEFKPSKSSIFIPELKYAHDESFFCVTVKLLWPLIHHSPLINMMKCIMSLKSTWGTIFSDSIDALLTGAWKTCFCVWHWDWTHLSKDIHHNTWSVPISENYICWLLCGNLVKISYSYHSINFPFSCMLMLLIMSQCNSIFMIAYQFFGNHVFTCVWAHLKSPAHPPGSRCSHDWIMKPIYHNKNLLAADVSVAVDFLVENILLKTIELIWITLSLPFCFSLDL